MTRPSPDTGRPSHWLRRTGSAVVIALIGAVAAVSADVHAADPFVPIAAVPLGLASTFGALTPAAFASTGATTFRGDIGAATISVLPPGTHEGTPYPGATADAARADVALAYANAVGRPAGGALSATIGGTTAGPGVQTNAAAVASTGMFTIDGQGHPDAVFIFQVNGALALAAGSHMQLVNGAQAKNVFWQVNGAPSIGAGANFIGTLLSNAAISSGVGNVINGRLLTTSGAIDVASNDVYSSPPSVSINGGTAAYTTSTSPVISGTTSVRSPSTVTVTIDGVADTVRPVPTSTGIWSFTPTSLLPNGNHPIVASVVDGAGNIGTYAQTLTVDTTPPAVAIDGGSVATTNDLTPTIMGTTDVASGQTVAITITRTTPPQILARTAVVQSDLTWNITPNGLTAGEWTVDARVVDPAGNANTATQILVIDTTPPAASITSNSLTNDSTPTISGTAETGATIAVSIDGLALGGVTLVGSDWSATATVALGHGNHNVGVTATDTAGNTTPVAQVLFVDLVLPIIGINPGPTDSTNDRTPTIVGTTDVAQGAIVSVSIDGGAAITTLVQSDGWNVTPSMQLPVGARTVVATISDPAGNVGSATQTLTIDTTAPGVTIDGGPSRTIADATPTISGVSGDVPVGSTVVLTINGQTLTTTIAVGGTFSVTALVIPNGNYFAFVTVVDAAGNTGTANQSLTIMAIAPTVNFTNGPAASTNDATPLISGTTTAAVGSAVVVTAAGQTLNATVQPGNSWNVTAANLTGVVDVVATVTDPDGNIGTATQTLTVDSTTPTNVLIAGGTHLITNDDTPMISGTTDAADGRVVTVVVAGQTLTVSATAGTWAVNANHVDDGTYNVTASVSSAGGNPGSTTQSLTIDTVDPVVVIGGGDGSVQTTDPTPTITGSDATPGSMVTVTVAGQTMITTVASDGAWSVTPSIPLPAGNNVVTVEITDPAGNTGVGTQTITVLAEATTITISGGTTAATNDGTPTISGSTNAADGRTMTVTVSTQTLTTTIALGAWAVTAAHLADGQYNVTASVSVADGTAAASSQTLTIDTVEPVVEIPPAVHTTNPTPPITGSGAPPGSTVTVVVAGQTLATTVAPDGTWSVTPTTPLPVGSNPAMITITDPAGNTATGTQIITVDPASPGTHDNEFTSVGPKRVFDTRVGQSPNALRAVAKKQVAGGYELKVQMTDLAGFVPVTGVGAVSLNVTSTESAAGGFITVYGCGTRELVSSVNFSTGQTVANAVVTPVSADGSVCFFANTPTDIIVDINGWFAAGAAFNAVGPKRVFDTRPDNSPDALRAVPKAKLAANETMEVRLTDLAGFVPARGVGSVSLNVVVTGPEASGFITVYACGSRALVSSVNFVAGQTVANAVIAPVSAQGTVCFYSLATTDLIVDINGWLEAGSDFHGVDPARVLDTRPGESSGALRDVPKSKIGGGNILQVQVTDLPGIVPSAGVSAVSLNVTTTNTAGVGFITVFACGTMEEVSSLNYDAGATIANAVLAPVSATGTICLYSSQPADVIVDLNGWMGAP
ncbi:MAG: Ig-like domain-containing protein [Ilumatobacteraceae bacterium]